MLATTDTSACTLISLPAELLLEIIPHIPYTPHNLQCVCLVCTHFKGLIKDHETSLVADIVKQPEIHDSLKLFPGLKPSYKGLQTLHSRLDVLDGVHDKWLHATSHGPDLSWMKGRWEAVYKAGLLLLYRLQDISDYDSKIKLLHTLPSTSLACLLFKLISSIEILRIHGPAPIHESFKRGDWEMRGDIELAFEELLLSHGPSFFIRLMSTSTMRDECVRLLESEIVSMPDRQASIRPPTLISSLRRAFANSIGCAMDQNMSKMWETLSSTRFDRLSEERIVELVHGREISGQFYRRMGF